MEANMLQVAAVSIDHSHRQQEVYNNHSPPHRTYKENHAQDTTAKKQK